VSKNCSRYTLQDNWTVKTIDLEDNFIGSEGAKDIAEVLSNSVTIIELVRKALKTLMTNFLILSSDIGKTNNYYIP